MNNLPKVGMRSIKTATAMMFSFLITVIVTNYLLPEALRVHVYDRSGPFYACIASSVCMQKSVQQTWKQGCSRMAGTTLAGLVGLIILLAIPAIDMYDHTITSTLIFSVAIFVGAIATIWVCNATGNKSSCSIACIVLVAVMINHGARNPYIFISVRLAQTFIGILVAVAVDAILPSAKQEPTA